MTNYLLDTNIILRFTDTDSVECDLINNAISQILVEGGQCFITKKMGKSPVIKDGFILILYCFICNIP